jgi:hypothetical protein
VATTCVSERDLRSAEPVLCRCLRVWEAQGADRAHRGLAAKSVWAITPDGSVDRACAQSS